jgi:uncharacterized membrane protein (DUF4010 family)
VILLMSVQTAGHIALRLWGARLGLALSGLASGFVTSAGTITVMGARARGEPALLVPCVAGALSSCAATFIQLGMVAAAVDSTVIPRLLPALAAALVATAIVTAPWLRGPAVRIGSLAAANRRVFDTAQTVGFALLLAGVSALLAWINENAANNVTMLMGALAGFADVHAATAAILTVGRKGGSVQASVASTVLFAITANTVTKVVGSLVGGGWRFCWRVSIGLLGMLGACWIGWWYASGY